MKEEEEKKEKVDSEIIIAKLEFIHRISLILYNRKTLAYIMCAQSIFFFTSSRLLFFNRRRWWQRRWRRWLYCLLKRKVIAFAVLTVVRCLEKCTRSLFRCFVHIRKNIEKKKPNNKNRKIHEFTTASFSNRFVWLYVCDGSLRSFFIKCNNFNFTFFCSFYLRRVFCWHNILFTIHE